MNILENNYDLNLNILIRCDSSNIIGTGHVMRCLNLCEYYPNHKFTFVCRNFNYNITNKIIDSNHKLILLEYNIEPELNNYKSWIGCDYKKEIDDLEKIIINNKYDQIIIDHYGIDHTIEYEIKKIINKLIIINEVYDYKHYCDEYINYNSDELELVKSINLNENTIYKIGIDYLILNKKFINKKKNNFNKEIKKICIMMGGSDPQNYTLKLIKEINNFIIEKNIFVYIIFGKSNINEESIINFINNENYKILRDLDYEELINIYNIVDLCIGSLSVTAYERLYLNVPQICLKIVENQNIQQLEQFNICNLNNIINKIHKYIY